MITKLAKSKVQKIMGMLPESERAKFMPIITAINNRRAAGMHRRAGTRVSNINAGLLAHPKKGLTMAGDYSDFVDDTTHLLDPDRKIVQAVHPFYSVKDTEAERAYAKSLLNLHEAAEQFHHKSRFATKESELPKKRNRSLRPKAENAPVNMLTGQRQIYPGNEGIFYRPITEEVAHQYSKLGTPGKLLGKAVKKAPIKGNNITGNHDSIDVLIDSDLGAAAKRWFPKVDDRVLKVRTETGELPTLKELAGIAKNNGELLSRSDLEAMRHVKPNSTFIPRGSFIEVPAFRVK